MPNIDNMPRGHVILIGHTLKTVHCCMLQLSQMNCRSAPISRLQPVSALANPCLAKQGNNVAWLNAALAWGPSYQNDKGQGNVDQ